MFDKKTALFYGAVFCGLRRLKRIYLASSAGAVSSVGASASGVEVGTTGSSLNMIIPSLRNLYPEVCRLMYWLDGYRARH